MINLKKIKKSLFAKNLAIIFSGNLINQIVLLVTYPIISRIYQPDDFGLFAQFQAILLILLLIISLRYDSAIIVAKNDLKAINLLALSFIIMIFLLLFILLIVITLGHYIAQAFSSPKLNNWLYFLPLFLLLAGSQQILNNWVIRKKNFKFSNYSNILKSSSNSILKLFFGFIRYTNSGLFISRGISFLLSCLILILREYNTLSNYIKTQIVKLPEIICVAKEYKKFPIFMSGGIIFNSLSVNVITLLISRMYGLTMIGYYALASATLNIPISMFRNAIQSVFYQRASERHNLGYNLYAELKKITFYFFLIALGPLLLLIFFGSQIYTFVLGDKWLITGQIASIISPWLFFTLIATPATSLVPVLGLQKYFVLFQLAIFVTRVIIFYVGYISFKELLDTILLLSVHGIFVNIFNLLYIFINVKRKENQLD